MLHPKRFGLIGQADFVPRCLLNGLLVAEPYGDVEPFDSLVGKLRPFWRVQIKACGSLSPHGMYYVGGSHRTGT